MVILQILRKLTGFGEQEKLNKLLIRIIQKNIQGNTQKVGKSIMR